MAGVLKPLEMAKQMVASVLKAGDVVLDATLGNGHDALFLAEQVGPEGLVYGCDIQQVAVQNSKGRLAQAGYQNFHFVEQGHEKMGEFVAYHHQGDLAAVMFNLGYLPSADKSVISKADTTLVAVLEATRLLRVGGIISIMCYPGHEGGDVEAEAVSECMSKLERREWRVVSYQFHNAPNNPAFLLIAEKL